MVMEHYYHMFANGDDAKNFITSEQEFKAAFNRIAVCAFIVGVVVLSFSIEDSHPHVLLMGTYSKCMAFKELYESLSIRYIARNRGSSDGVILHCELEEVTDEAYLMNVGTYTIIQATKDGKSVMPYDYRYGTGSLYFRDRYSVLPWLVNDDGEVVKPVTLGSLTVKERQKLCGTKTPLPDEWLVCNGFILPTNYVDIKRFESIYRTHNCFRVFMSSSKKRDEEVLSRMSSVRGTLLEDLEARRICKETCQDLFSKSSTRHLTVQQRIILAQTLRNRYCIAYRQLAFLVHIPESELRKYVK